jgi:hypothetical protein
MAAAVAALFALGTSATTPAHALPNGVQTAKPAIQSGQLLHEVRNRDWRRRHYRRHRRDYDDWGLNPGAFIALGIAGALIERGMSEDRVGGAMERCASEYRSFEYETGLYTTYGGEKRVCPYLR